MKKAVVYFSTDFLFSTIIIIFLLAGMYYYTKIDENRAENIVTEKKDIVTANQDIVTFLRTPMKAIVPNIGTFPKETQDMTFAAFFIWYGHSSAKIPYKDFNKGVEEFFQDYRQWSVRLDTKEGVRYKHGYQAGDAQVYIILLPTMTDKELKMYFHFKR